MEIGEYRGLDMKMQILFLDIDGVLNCKNSKTYYNAEYPEKYSLDERLWKNLQKFLSRFPDVKVVIHSGWIKHKDDPNYTWDMGHPELGIKLKTQLPEVVDRLGDRFFGYVPYMKGKSKSKRIAQWLLDHDALDNPKCQCIVLDDDRSDYAELLELEKYCNVCVKFTNTNTGFDSVSLSDAIEIGEVIFK